MKDQGYSGHNILKTSLTLTLCSLCCAVGLTTLQTTSDQIKKERKHHKGSSDGAPVLCQCIWDQPQRNWNMTYLMRSDTCAILNPDLISKLDGRLRRNGKKNKKRSYVFFFFNEKSTKRNLLEESEWACQISLTSTSDAWMRSRRWTQRDNYWSCR